MLFRGFFSLSPNKYLQYNHMLFYEYLLLFQYLLWSLIDSVLICSHRILTISFLLFQ